MRTTRIVVAAAAGLALAAGAAEAQTWSGELADCEDCWHVYEFDIEAEPGSDVAQTGVIMAWDNPDADMVATVSCAYPGEAFEAAGTTWGDDGFLRLSVGVFAARDTCEAFLAAYGGTVKYSVNVGGARPRLVSNGRQFTGGTADALRHRRYEALAERLADRMAQRRRHAPPSPGAAAGRE